MNYQNMTYEYCVENRVHHMFAADLTRVFNEAHPDNGLEVIMCRDDKRKMLVVCLVSHIARTIVRTFLESSSAYYDYAHAVFYLAGFHDALNLNLYRKSSPTQ